jgi:acylglycerol lipase
MSGQTIESRRVSASQPTEVQAEYREDQLEGVGGLKIFWRSWTPAEPKAVLVIAHGGAEHGGRYRYVVERLVPEGFAVYAIDHRGHGRSDGRRAQITRMACVVEDLDRLVRRANEEHPRLPLFLLGHSVGGCIATAYALEHQDRLTGLVLSGPVAAVEAAPLPLRLIAKAASVLTPDLGLLQVEAEGVSRDPAEVAAYDGDPLVYRGKLPARTLQELADTIGRFPGEAPRITLPVVMQLGMADRIVPPQGGEALFERLGSQDKTLHPYEGYFHEIYNEPPAERARALDDLAGWLLARV